MLIALIPLVLQALPVQASGARPEAEAPWVASQQIVFDGDPSEWTRGAAPIRLSDPRQLVSLGPPTEDGWSGPEDASLELWVGWNADDLLLGGVVLDETADHDPGTWYRGDSLELFVNVVDREPEWGLDDFQLMIAPDWAERPWGVYARPQASVRPGPSAAGFGGIEVASRPLPSNASARGYRFEVKIPWSNFGGFVPADGLRVPFNFALCDRDGRGQLESYMTWTGERDIATWADRRGDLVLGDVPAGAVAAEAAPAARLPSFLLLFLAAMYAAALATRRVWRRPAARRWGVIAAALLMTAAGALALTHRLSADPDGAGRRAQLERYWTRFEALLASGALGHPEPAQLVRDAQALLDGESITRPPETKVLHLAPNGAVQGAERRSARRGLPFRPFGIESGARADGISIAPGESCELELAEPTSIEALQLITRVSDRAFLSAGPAQVPVLSVEFLRGGEDVVPAREVRHRQDLHLDEEEHREHPGLEPALREPGGRLGSLHADGLLLELGAAHEIDRVRLRHVGIEPGYSVSVVACTAIARGPWREHEGLRPSGPGECEWSDWKSNVHCEVTQYGRGPRDNVTGTLRRSIKIGSEAVATVYLRDTTPAQGTSRDFLPLALAAAIAPFLVALLAEWLATVRRIRGKLAIGFAITSAVPLLGLTLLLEASLGQEHEVKEAERVAGLLARSAADLERDQAELEREAGRLLQIAELGSRIEGRFPESPEELSSPRWWGEGEPGEIRMLEWVQSDGRRRRQGSGPGWREIPRSFSPRTSDVLRPWGELMVCGVRQTSSGAEQPLMALVARPARLSADLFASGEVRLLGAGRDPAPRLDDLQPADEREERRGVFSSQRDLVAVLVARRRARGMPVFGDYSLTELLFACGLTAVFTAALFAGILTGNIVRPIEHLHRAVREGRPFSVQPTVRDEVGHLTTAIGSFTSQIARRVRQLETLQVAQERFSSHLDSNKAREAVIAFFASETAARDVWLAWAGEDGEVPRLFGARERSLAIPEGSAFLRRALVASEPEQLEGPELETQISKSERPLLRGERVLSLPLVAAGEVRGAIALSLDGRRELDLAFLRAAASQAAIVLENARLYQQAVVDPVTGFLFEAGFKQRLSEEIRRAEAMPEAGVLVVQVRLMDLSEDDARKAGRLREAARRMRQAVRRLAVFGRSGSADLRVAIPWSEMHPDCAAQARHIVERISGRAWPDGEPVGGLLSSWAAWPDDGPSGRLILHHLAERLAEVQSSRPKRSLGSLGADLPAGFVAASPLMLELLETTRRVAEQDVGVLIVGETGVGKDRIAQLVHRWSARREGPLVNIHCPSLSASLIEDELFGHEAGAFTGATSRRVSPFQFAAGGTVVLDEVGGLSAGGQVALLRLIETREVTPLGSSKPISIDVRIVATTSSDLATRVERGTFRGDLYFRLNVAQLTVPPLRLRRADLPELVNAAIGRFNASAARPVTGVSAEVLDMLYDHDWPGNLRELEGVLSGALILAGGSELSPEHLTLDLDPGDAGHASRPARPINPRQQRSLEDLQAGNWISSAEYAKAHGVSARTALRDLMELADEGYLVREGLKRGTRFRRSKKGWGASSVQ